MIVNSTNLYAIQHAEEQVEMDIEPPDFQQTNRCEIRAYIGLCLLRGVFHGSREAMKTAWQDDAATKRPIFSATMSRNRFQQLNRFIRLDDRTTRIERMQNRPDAAIAEFSDALSERFRTLYHPSTNLTVDEQLIRFFGKCKFRVYMPNKPDRYGIKLFVLADAANGYALNYQIYTGRAGTDGPERNQAQRVVLQLTQFLESGYNITTDNFYTSYQLAQLLLQRDNPMSLVGTMRKHKPEIPTQFLSTEGRREQSSIFGFTEDATIVSYSPKPRRIVVLLSTQHHDSACSDHTNGFKPHIIDYYNHTKIGVDLLDQKVKAYRAQRTTRRWPHAVFLNLIGIAAYNSFVIWRMVHPEWKANLSHKRREFLIQLGKSLVKPHVQVRERAGLHQHIIHAIQITLNEELHAELPQEATSSGRCYLCRRIRD